VAVQGEDTMPKKEQAFDCDVWVVSRGRWKSSKTLESIKESVPVKLAVHKSEFVLYKDLSKKYNVELVGLDYKEISDKRVQISKLSGDKFMMLDDDLRFFKRNSKEDFRLVRCTAEQMLNMFNLLSKYLDTYTHTSISARQGNNTQDYPVVYNSRYMRVLAYQNEAYQKCKLGRVRFMEDFDINLQLLRMGYPSVVITTYAQDQYDTQREGGCSSYRTKEAHEEAAVMLARLHDPFVKLRQKKNKTGGEFGTRTEVTIQWAKAYKSSQRSNPKTGKP
jgi:hypothetical protein